MAKTFDTETEEEIYHQFVNGKTKSDLAKEYKVPVSVIFSVIRRQSLSV